MRLNPYKKGFRVLGIAESFRRRFKWSVLFGVVMRRDLVIDGSSCALISVGGLDATEGVLTIYKKLNRSDVNALLLNGCVISWFNIIDLERIFEETNVPVICVTYEESEGLEEFIRRYFPEDYEVRISMYRKLGPREKMYLRRTGKTLYVRYVGADRDSVEELLKVFTLSGAVPEPLRIANLMARAVLNVIQGG
ncbi:MAG TPA: DUF99 family protein [Thermofilum sp.]|nr:DUF99 family protein [Thermofilum sp.]